MRRQADIQEATTASSAGGEGDYCTFVISMDRLVAGYPYKSKILRSAMTGSKRALKVEVLVRTYLEE